jgi:hypothetical protein
MNTEQICPCDNSDYLDCKAPTHEEEWYHINTIKDEDEDIRDYLTLIQPEAEPTAWQVDYDGEGCESQYTVYGGVSRQEAIDKAVKIIKRDGRLPHYIYYKEEA